MHCPYVSRKDFYAAFVFYAVFKDTELSQSRPKLVSLAFLLTAIVDVSSETLPAIYLQRMPNYTYFIALGTILNREIACFYTSDMSTIQQ